MRSDHRVQKHRPISIGTRWIVLLSLTLALLAVLALLPSVPKEVRADNNGFTFQGQYTSPACGTRHEFTVGPGTRTIDVVASTVPANDIVLNLYYNGKLIVKQDTGTSPEPIHYGSGATDLPTGTYQVEVCPFDSGVLNPADYAAVVIVSEAPLPGMTVGNGVGSPIAVRPAPIDAGERPRYQSHTPTAAQMQAGMSKNSQDEPNIGVNWSSGKVMLQALQQTLQVTFDDQSCPQTPPSTWNDVSPISAKRSFDPILFNDHQTNRTFVSHLLIAGSASAYTDNDGKDWINSDGAGIASGIDHQTVGGGPFHAPLPPLPGYPNAVYYCSQDIAFANCALSLNGGLSFGPALPIYALASPNTGVVGQCGGLHGHLKVGPDGTVYVPNATCQGPVNPSEAGVVVSEDNGITWSVRTIPGTSGGENDPSAALDDGGLLYLGFTNEDKFPSVAVSADRGKTWTNVYEVGAMAGVKNAMFPAMVAGSAGRAAMAFYGTTKEGSVNDFNSEAVWHLYVAHTYDGGAHWVTVNATPNDPIQRGGIHAGGGSFIHRNLLDFFDADTDRFGRMTVGYADGCIGGCVQTADAARGNSFTAYGTIARQTGGRRLFFGSDPTQPTVPGAPRLTVTRNGSVSTLTWSQSEDGGSAITGYNVYRTAGGPEQLIATLGGDASRYVDTSGDSTTEYTYRVSASNAVGTSCGNNAAISKPAGGSCHANGLRIIDDASGDQTGAPLESDMDIQWVSIGEPYFADGSRKLVFKMKVANLSSLTPNRMWRILWSYPDAPANGNPTSTEFVGRYYIGMNVNADGTTTFEYGIAQSLSAVVADVLPTERFGAADPESGFSADGTITLVISADKVGAPGVGDLIGGVIARSYPVAQGVTLRSDSATDSASLGNTYVVVGNAACTPPTTASIEDNDPSIAYGNGWHLVNSSSASDGHFRLQSGKGNAVLSFSVGSGRTGQITYDYATSTKGGSADVYVDGALKGRVTYNGGAGSLREPVFGAKVSYGGIGSGNHTLEIRPVSGAVYLENFKLESASSFGQPASGPGQTSSNTSTLSAGQELLKTVSLGSGTEAISVLVDTNLNVPFKVVLIDPAGSVLGAVDSSSGIAVIDKSVSKPGNYLIKVVNLSLGPLQVTATTTPLVSR